MAKLEERLTKLVYDYSSKGKLADGIFIDIALTLGIHDYDIYNYVKSYEIDNSRNYLPTGYSIDKRYIRIDQNALLEDGINRVRQEENVGITSTAFVKNLKVNLSVVSGVINVLSHAVQYKTCLEGPDNIEKEVLELALERNLKLVRKENLPPETLGYNMLLDSKYQEEIYYRALPSERMAEINGLEFEKNISKLISDDRKDNLDTYTDWKLVSGQINTYAAQSPTSFIKCINENLKVSTGLPYGETDLDKIEEMYREKSKNYSLERRLYLGLPITEEERNKMLIKRDVLKESL